MENEKKICPWLCIADGTTGQPCRGEACALFVRGGCAIADIAESQAEIAVNSSGSIFN